MILHIDMAGDLLREALPARHSGIRLLGVGVSGLTPAAIQRTLFDEESRQHRKLDTVADAVRHRFGTDVFGTDVPGRGSGLLHETRHRR